MLDKSSLCYVADIHEETFYFSKHVKEMFEIAQKHRGRTITAFGGFGFLRLESISLTHLDMQNPLVGIGFQTKLADLGEPATTPNSSAN